MSTPPLSNWTMFDASCSGEVAVGALHADGVRARADEAHVAFQHVQELRQFVETGAAQEAADLCDARIVRRHLLQGRGGVVYPSGRA